MNTTVPQVGQTIIAFGKECVVVRVLPFGTIEIKSPDGKYFRMTGLSFL